MVAGGTSDVGLYFCGICSASVKIFYTFLY